MKDDTMHRHQPCKLFKTVELQFFRYNSRVDGSVLAPLVR